MVKRRAEGSRPPSSSTARFIRSAALLSWAEDEAEVPTRAQCCSCICARFKQRRVCLAFWCDVARFCQDPASSYCTGKLIPTEMRWGFILCLAVCERQVRGSSPRWWSWKAFKCIASQAPRRGQCMVKVFYETNVKNCAVIFVLLSQQVHPLESCVQWIISIDYDQRDRWPSS